MNNYWEQHRVDCEGQSTNGEDMAGTPEWAKKPSLSRAETAAERIAELARNGGAGVRLGSREELRALCGVSVGTLHEALRLLQSTGEIFVRTGPGGGVFAGESSPLSDLVRSIHGQVFEAPLFPQTARVLQALRPLIFADAVANLDDTAAAVLRERLSALEAASDGELRDFVRSSLEVFATIVSIPPAGILKTVAAAILRAQMDTLRELAGPIEPRLRSAVDGHVQAVSRMVGAILDSDAAAAIEHSSDRQFLALFEAVAGREESLG
jgi:DNA-binding FadR family transcriptional regulator